MNWVVFKLKVNNKLGITELGWEISKINHWLPFLFLEFL